MKLHDNDNESVKARIQWVPKAVFGATLLLFAAFLSIPRFGLPEPGLIYSNINHARQIITALKIYASDHHGTYPKSLEELVKENVLDRESLERLNQFRVGTHEKPQRWMVFLDVKDADPFDLPLVVSPGPVRGPNKYILGSNDSSVRVASKKEYDDALERLRKFREERDRKPVSH